MPTNHQAPSLALMGMEPVRAMFDYAASRIHKSNHLPHGSGEPVIVIPGLATNHHSTKVLRNKLTELNYRAEDWGQGMNTGPKGEDLHEWLSPLLQRLRDLVEDDGRKACLVGWSLGGIAARELAKMAPKLVRKVITLGTPFASLEDSTNAGWAYEMLNGGRKPEMSAALALQLRREPPVSTVSVFSKSDGIVSWSACMQPNARRTRHVEVAGVSHFGMVLNQRVIEVLAQELVPNTRSRYVRGVAKASGQ